MSDLISRSELLRYIDGRIDENKEELDDAKERGNERDADYIRGKIIEARRTKSYVNMFAPAVDAVPVAHARWVDPCINKYGHPCIHCSACRGRFKASQQDRNFCPNCGAKMDGGAEA